MNKRDGWNGNEASRDERQVEDWKPESRAFDQAVSETKARNASVPDEAIEADIEEALTAVRAMRFRKNVDDE